MLLCSLHNTAMLLHNIKANYNFVSHLLISALYVSSNFMVIESRRMKAEGKGPFTRPWYSWEDNVKI